MDIIIVWRDHTGTTRHGFETETDASEWLRGVLSEEVEIEGSGIEILQEYRDQNLDTLGQFEVFGIEGL